MLRLLFQAPSGTSPGISPGTQHTPDQVMRKPTRPACGREAFRQGPGKFRARIREDDRGECAWRGMQMERKNIYLAPPSQHPTRENKEEEKEGVDINTQSPFLISASHTLYKTHSFTCAPPSFPSNLYTPHSKCTSLPPPPLSSPSPSPS